MSLWKLKLSPLFGEKISLLNFYLCTTKLAVHKRIHNSFFLLFFFLLIYDSLFAQSLPNSRLSSYHTYLYQLEETEAKRLYEKGIQSIEESFLHTVLDSFPTDSSYKKQLAIGHYLFVRTQEHQLVLELQTVGKLRYQIIDNQRDLILLVHDSLGNAVSMVQVWVGGKQLPRDPLLDAFRLPKSRKEGLVRIQHEGHTDYYRIDAKNGPVTIKRVLRRIVYTIPIRWVWGVPYNFVAGIVSSVRYRYPNGWIGRLIRPFNSWYWDEKWSNRIRRKYGNSSYLITNQPKYRPGDTVRVKAFLMTKAGREVRRELPLILAGNQCQGEFSQRTGYDQTLSTRRLYL